MATAIDSVSIRGMKYSDFEQLEEMYDHVKEEGVYWGRKDYWDSRIERLDRWFNQIRKETQGVIIKSK